MDTRLWSAVDCHFQNFKFGDAIKLLERDLANETGERFKGLLGRSFTNAPRSILSAINQFIDSCDKSIPIKAVYLEMNGFDINPDRWYFDFFGYTKYGADPQDLEWLCDWQSPSWPEVTLEGLELVQADFEWYHKNRVWKDETFQHAYDLAVLLVMCKYVSLIESALASGTRPKSIPVLATAHDFDIVGRFEI